MFTEPGPRGSQRGRGSLWAALSTDPLWSCVSTGPGTREATPLAWPPRFPWELDPPSPPRGSRLLLVLRSPTSGLSPRPRHRALFLVISDRCVVTWGTHGRWCQRDTS